MVGLQTSLLYVGPVYHHEFPQPQKNDSERFLSVLHHFLFVLLTLRGKSLIEQKEEEEVG